MRWVLALFLAAGLLLGVGLLLLPPDLYPYVAASAIFVVVALLALSRPILLLLFIILTSAAGAGIRHFQALSLGHSHVTLEGVQWAFVWALATFAILANIGRISVPWPFLGFGVFGSWLVFRWITAGPTTVGLKELGLYLFPVSIALYAILAALQGREALVNRVESFYLYSAVVPILLYAIYIPLGLTPWTVWGPTGLFNPRPVALYLLAVLASSLAMWRYGRNPTWSRRGRLLSLVAIGTILFTLSRTASVAAVLLLVFSRINPRRLWALAPRLVAGMTLGAVLLVGVPIFRERSFFRSGGTLSQQLAYFNTSGRKILWPAVYEHALQNPILGWGPGSAKLLLAQIVHEDVEAFPAHNEYLEVFHDTGLVGLILMLFAWGWLVWMHWRHWGQADAVGDAFRARWNLAALLGLAAILLTAVTDNTIHYAKVYGPVFILVAFAHYANTTAASRGRPLSPGTQSSAPLRRRTPRGV